METRVKHKSILITDSEMMVEGVWEEEAIETEESVRYLEELEAEILLGRGR